MLKDLKVDWDNPSDLKKHISMLQKRRKDVLRKNCSYTGIKFAMSKLNFNDIYWLFEFLHQLPCPTPSETAKYYVYVHCDPTRPLVVMRDIREYLLATKYKLTHMPFYVGKGIDDRCYDLSRNEGHRKVRSRIISKSQEVQVIKVLENLDESTALFEEQKLISFLGLSSLDSQGYLVNLQTDKSILDVYLDALKAKYPIEESIVNGKVVRNNLKIGMGVIKRFSSWI
jgi:hypothetical protein